MANESLDKRIDQLTNVPEIVVRPDGTKIPDPTEFEFQYGNVLDDLLPPTEKQTTKPFSESPTVIASSEDTPFTTEKVDVAALNLKNLIKKFKPEMVEKEILDQIPNAPVSGKPPKVAFNLDLIDSEDGIKQQIETLAQIDGLNKYKKISYKQIADEFPDLIDRHNGRYGNFYLAVLLRTILESGKEGYYTGDSDLLNQVFYNLKNSTIPDTLL